MKIVEYKRKSTSIHAFRFYPDELPGYEENFKKLFRLSNTGWQINNLLHDSWIHIKPGSMVGIQNLKTLEDCYPIDLEIFHKTYETEIKEDTIRPLPESEWEHCKDCSDSGSVPEHGCDGSPTVCEATCPIPAQCEFCWINWRSAFFQTHLLELPIVIFDLDGTLADISDRKYLVECDNPDWNTFYRACIYDQPKEEIIALTRLYENAGYQIYIFSGRSDIVRKETIEWLAYNKVKYHILKMRKDGDTTPDEELKRIWLNQIPRSYIDIVFDDRDKVVKMWREEGITCCQVAEGKF